MKSKIIKLIDNRDYSGVILKLIAKYIDGKWVNFFTSFVFANSKYMEMSEVEWLHYSGERVTAKDYNQLKGTVEFNKEDDGILLIRKHLSIKDTFSILDNIINHQAINLNGKIIKTDVKKYNEDIYKIGSSCTSIFSSANTYLHRMADVLVMWPQNDDIFTLKEPIIIKINDIPIINPIFTLMGFCQCNVPNELCSSIVIYFPNYTAWLSREKFADGKKVEVGIGSENMDLLRDLRILYKIEKSNEIVMLNSYSFENIEELPKNGQNFIFYQPVDRDIDKSMFFLIDKDFNIHDFSLPAPYVKTLNISMDILSEKRKYRQNISIGNNRNDIDILSKRKALITSIKKETVLFTSGDQISAIEAVKKILDSAKNTIKIFDPYFGNDFTDWNIFSEVASNIEIYVLTSIETRHNVHSNFYDSLNNLRREMSKVELKSVYADITRTGNNSKKCPFHDRYFIIDNKIVWSIGTSINGLGKRDSSIIRIAEGDIDAILKLFDYYWTEPNPIFKMLMNNNWLDFPIMRNDL